MELLSIREADAIAPVCRYIPVALLSIIIILLLDIPWRPFDLF
jgi:hypothetical protein